MLNAETQRCSGNILVVDDTKDDLKLLVKTLGDAGYTVRPSLNGPLALKAARKEVPDLILLDIMMPVMDGYQVAAELKGDEATRHIPIIFISALDDVLDKVKSFSVGGVDYITKPIQVGELLARVKTHLTLRELVRRIEEKNLSLQEMNRKLQRALDEIKTLRGILPICANCKKIRDDQGYWNQIEAYISAHSEAEFSHSICPDCVKILYPDYYDHRHPD